jgi:hypothetical protein
MSSFFSGYFIIIYNSQKVKKKSRIFENPAKSGYFEWFREGEANRFDFSEKNCHLKFKSEPLL